MAQRKKLGVDLLQEAFDNECSRGHSNWYIRKVESGSLKIQRNMSSGPGCFESLVIWAKINDGWVGNYPSVKDMREDFQKKAEMYAQAVKDIDNYGRH